jgi:hypothetical protein
VGWNWITQTQTWSRPHPRDRPALTATERRHFTGFSRLASLGKGSVVAHASKLLRYPGG